MACVKTNVGIRLRPLLPEDTSKNRTSKWGITDNTIFLLKSKEDIPRTVFYCENLFDIDASTNTVFEMMAKPIVLAAVYGFHGAVFAYGQSSSGKTHTMMGNEKMPGMIPLGLKYMFEIMRNIQGRKYIVSMSYVKICGENVLDLLHMGMSSVETYQGAAPGCILKEEVVDSPEKILDLISMAEKYHYSSQSNMPRTTFYTVLRVRIAASNDISGTYQVSWLTFIDLAGSELMEEGCSTTQSVNSLWLVLHQLMNGVELTHCHGNKLMTILQPSLTNTCNIAIICTVSPVDVEESIRTLRFAAKVNAIRLKPSFNNGLKNILPKQYPQAASSQTNLKAGAPVLNTPDAVHDFPVPGSSFLDLGIGSSLGGGLSEESDHQAPSPMPFVWEAEVQTLKERNRTLETCLAKAKNEIEANKTQLFLLQQELAKLKSRSTLMEEVKQAGKHCIESVQAEAATTDMTKHLSCPVKNVQTTGILNTPDRIKILQSTASRVVQESQARTKSLMAEIKCLRKENIILKSHLKHSRIPLMQRNIQPPKHDLKLVQQETQYDGIPKSSRSKLTRKKRDFSASGHVCDSKVETKVKLLNVKIVMPVNNQPPLPTSETQEIKPEEVVDRSHFESGDKAGPSIPQCNETNSQQKLKEHSVIKDTSKMTNEEINRHLQEQVLYFSAAARQHRKEMEEFWNTVECDISSK